MILSYRSISNSLGASNFDMREYAGKKNIQLINKYHGNIEVIINKSLWCVVDDKKNLRCRNVYMSVSVHVLRRCVGRVLAILYCLFVTVVRTQKGQVATNAVENASESGRMGRIVRSAEFRRFFRFDLASSRIIPQTAATQQSQPNVHQQRKHSVIKTQMQLRGEVQHGSRRLGSCLPQQS